MKPERLNQIRVFCIGLLLCNSGWVAAQTDENDEDETLNAATLTEAPPPSIPRPATEELFVTGSYIKGLTQDQLASPLQTINREDILNLGAVQMLDIVNNLTINNGSENNTDAFTQNYTTGTSNFNLRGLGVASTLVLLNGRRQTYSAFANDKGENFVDTSSLIPLIAVDSIEILKDGATSLYGSDAVAGVVNFKTRKNFDGFEVEIDTQSGVADQANNSISAIYGHNGANTQFMAAFSYLKRDGVGTDKRRLSTLEDDFSIAGFPGSFLLPTQPTTPGLDVLWTAVFDSAGIIPGIADFFEPLLGQPPVPGALQPIFADFDCQNIAATDDTTVPPGTFPVGPCGFDFGSFFTVVPEEKNTKLFGTLTHQFSNGIELYVEAGFASFEADRRSSPSFPITSTPRVCGSGSLDPVLGDIILLDENDPSSARNCSEVNPTGHPFNPYGIDVLFVGRVAASGADAAITHFESDTSRLAIALSGEFSNWNWSIDSALSKNEYSVSSEDTLKRELNLALVGLGGENCDPLTGTAGQGDCLFFNPFGSSLTVGAAANSQEIMDFITGTLLIRAESELQTFSGVINGPLFSLPGGDASLAVGAQLRKETLSYDYDENSNNENFLFTVGNPDFDAEREVVAAFGELALPILDNLSVQFSLRYEDYDDAGDSVDPKLAVLFNPIDGLSLRGSIATAFRAPSLFQQNGIRIVLNEISVPVLGTQFIPVRAQPRPGDPLKPEEADILNIGASWGHDEGFNISADYWYFDYSNVIIQQNPQAILNAALGGDPEAQSQVEFSAGGTIERINTYYTNASTLTTDGIDLKTGYNWLHTSTGSYMLGLELTKVLSYDIEDPQAGKVDGLGKRNFGNFATSTPELRANLHGGWHGAKHAVLGWVRYIDSYINDQRATDEPIASHRTIDLQYSYHFDPIGSASEGITVHLGGYNVTDEKPPHVKTSGGYDSKVHDPRGRLYYLKATIPF